MPIGKVKIEIHLKTIFWNAKFRIVMISGRSFILSRSELYYLRFSIEHLIFRQNKNLCFLFKWYK